MSRWVPFHDLIAGIATLGLLAGILLLTVLEQAVPQYLSGAFTVALGWALRGGVQASNDLRHRKKVNNDS